MQSTCYIERLIAEKRREIEKEKTQLGLSPQLEEHQSNDNKENVGHPDKIKKQVRFSDSRVFSERNGYTKDKNEKAIEQTQKEFDDFIPASLERYIRRYIGLPVMLKAGEYSPNNPLVRGERAPGDALLGLGEYERRRNTLRKIQQQQYREYLDQQAKKKQEAKQQLERERREREQREKEREEKERELIQERDRFSPERRRSVTLAHSTASGTRDQHSQYVPQGETSGHTIKVDTGVQVDGFSQPLSVAVQTDETEMFRLSPSPTMCQLTQAERELSPRSVHAWAPTHTQHYTQGTQDTQHRRRSYGDFDERSCLLKKCRRDKLSELRHTYMPSIFDADAIQRRNLEAEQEAAERRQYYQQELKNQIEEQQRIREERKNREKLLEQAEMRRLEEQLRMLRVAQDREVGKQRQINADMKEAALEYNSKRTELQREIDAERKNLLRITSQPNRTLPTRTTTTSNSDTLPQKLPFYYSKIHERTDKKPYSMNIPDNSIFSSNYDVDTYLRRNLNFNKEKDFKKDIGTENTKATDKTKSTEDIMAQGDNVIVEKALIHEQPNKERGLIHEQPNKERGLIHEQPNKEKEIIHELSNNNRPNEKEPSRNINNDTLIPVLRHTPRPQSNETDNTNMSEAMKKVDDKWKVPAVQKNILKALPNEEGRNVSILTQLGSIRRQLQLEQLKLDQKLTKDDNA